MNEEVIIRGLLNKEAYYLYSPVLGGLKGLEREHRQVLQALDSYWVDYPEADRLTPDELVLYFDRLNPALKDKGLYDEILGRIKEVQIDNQALLADELRNLVETQYAGEILKLALLKVEGQRSSVVDEIRTQIESFDMTVGKVDVEDGVLQDVTLEKLFEQQRGPYNWRLPFLAEQLAYPPLGTLGHIFARPNVGKTSFAVFEAIGFAHQMRGTEDKVLFLGNEESLWRTALRAFVSFAGRPAEWLEAPENEAEMRTLWERYERIIKPHLIFIDGIHHINQIEAALKRYKPKVVFIDQGPKVRSLTTETGPAVLTALFNWLREAAKRHNVLMITTGQADAAADNRQRLSLSNLDGSKVGVPGELDFAIGISALDEQGKEWVRYFSIVKYKSNVREFYYRGHLDTEKARYK